MRPIAQLAGAGFKWLALVGLTVLLTLGHVWDFAPGLMRAASLIACLVLLPAAWAARKRDLASPIDLTMAGFCLLTGVGFWLWPWLGRLVTAYPEPVLYALFLLTATVPQLIGKPPFTSYFARKRTPQAVRETSIYRDINRIMSWTWAGIFALVLASTLVSYQVKGSWLHIVLLTVIPLALLLGFGLPFTKHYPDYHQRRLGLDPVSAPQAGEEDRPDSAPLQHSGAPETKERTMSSKPSIVAVCGSPHVGMGNTDMMVEMMRPALEEEGFSLERINLNEKNIGFCQGCALCLEKGKCWQADDHKAVVDKFLRADGIILGSPVYFFHVTAQMKTFLDRSLPLGHKPRGTWKPGVAVCVSAGYGETEVAEYLGNVLRTYGAWCVGRLTAMATAPGNFLGKELVEQRAEELARELAAAIKRKKRRPATDKDLYYWMFMGQLVQNHREFMRDDYEHWQELGLFDSFESYVGQARTQSAVDPALRKAWLEQLIARHKNKQGGRNMSEDQKAHGGRGDIGTCREMIAAMPLAFNPEAAGEMNKVIQFEVSGDEEFTSHLKIENGTCTHHEGPAQDPDLVVQTPAEVWLGVSKGEIDGAQAFMGGKYKVQGDMNILLKMNQLFGKG